MKSENKISENERQTKAHINSDDYDNEISAGNMGSESGYDNGASTLRGLHKKYANKSAVKSQRKPML